MATRTNAYLVKQVLQDDYGQKEDGALPTLEPFMLAANLLTTRMASSAAKVGYVHTTEEKKVIETWLSAHFYVMSDQNYSVKSTGGASATFQGHTRMHLDASKYGQSAVMLDTSGTLRSMSRNGVIRIAWLGLPQSQQTDYLDRN